MKTLLVIIILLVPISGFTAENKKAVAPKQADNRIYKLSEKDDYYSGKGPAIYLYCIAGYKVVIEKMGMNDSTAVPLQLTGKDGKPITCNE